MLQTKHYVENRVARTIKNRAYSLGFIIYNTSNGGLGK